MMRKKLNESDRFILAQLGGRIQNIRINNFDWTQGELAEYSSLTPNHISLIEGGKRNMSLITLRKIAQAFEMTINELCNFKFYSKKQKYFKNGTHI